MGTDYGLYFKTIGSAILTSIIIAVMAGIFYYLDQRILPIIVAFAIVSFLVAIVSFIILVLAFLKNIAE